MKWFCAVPVLTHSCCLYEIWVVFYTGMVLASVTISCLASVSSIRVSCPNAYCAAYVNHTKKYTVCATSLPSELQWLSICINIVFLIETTAKFLAWPGRKVLFFKNVINVIDVLGFVLTLFALAIEREAPDVFRHHIVLFTAVSGIASVLKVGRMVQFFKHNKELRVLVLALKFSQADLLLLLFLLSVTMVTSAMVIYIAELDGVNNFMSIPHGMWWSLITLTTVGYGHMVPSTLPGYLVGIVCALLGVVITGAAIPLTANNFQMLTDMCKLVGRKRY